MNFIENEPKLVTLNNLITQDAPNFDLYLWSACDTEDCSNDTHDFYTVNGGTFDPTNWTSDNFAEYCFNTVGTFWIVCQAKNVIADDSCFYKFKVNVEESITSVTYTVTPYVCGVPVEEYSGNVHFTLLSNRTIEKLRISVNAMECRISTDEEHWNSILTVDVVNDEADIYIRFRDTNKRVNTDIEMELTSLNSEGVEYVGTTEIKHIRYLQPITIIKTTEDNAMPGDPFTDSNILPPYSNMFRVEREWLDDLQRSIKFRDFKAYRYYLATYPDFGHTTYTIKYYTLFDTPLEDIDETLIESLDWEDQTNVVVLGSFDNDDLQEAKKGNTPDNLLHNILWFAPVVIDGKIDEEGLLYFQHTFTLTYLQGLSIGHETVALIFRIEIANNDDGYTDPSCNIVYKNYFNPNSHFMNCVVCPSDIDYNHVIAPAQPI